jgi:hypothetical protein
MSASAHERVVAAWLNDLSILISGSYSQAEQQAKVAALTGVLADAFPQAAAFTKESLYAVSRVAREMTFPELHKRLDGWWQANKATPLVALAGDVPAGMPAADRSMIVFWREYISGAKPRPDNMSLDTWLSMIRKPTPAAFAFLCNTCNTASSIAVRHGWIIDRRVRPTEDEIAAVHDAAGQVVAAARAKYGPIAYPPEAPVQPAPASAAPTPPVIAAVAATDEARPSPVPAKTLAPEHLVAYRKAAGINLPPPASAPPGSRPFAARPANDAHPPPAPVGSPGGPFPWS